jgi:hypothetical protein
LSNDKNEVPSHLKHINRKDDDTQKVIKALKGDTPDSPTPKKPTGVLSRGSTSGAMSPADLAVKNFYDRLDQPWVKHSLSRVQFLRSQISTLKRKDPAGLTSFLKKENALLDAMKASHEEKKKQENEKATEHHQTFSQKPGFLELLKLWWFRLQHPSYFANGEPSPLVFDFFQHHLIPLTHEFIPVVSTILDTLYNQDFFPTYAQRSYNVLTLLSREKLGLALARITSTEIDSNHLEEKIHELDDLTKILFQLFSETSIAQEIISTVEDIQTKISDSEKLHPFTKTLLTLTPGDLKKASDNIKIFLSPQHQNEVFSRLIALYSHLVNRVITTNDLQEFLQFEIPPFSFEMELTTTARAHQSTLLREQSSEKTKLEEELEHTHQLDLELAFAETFFNSKLDDCNPHEKHGFEEDPFSYFNKHILDFLVIFEDMLSGRERLSFVENDKHTFMLIDQMPPESLKSISAFPIKQDLQGKIKKPLNVEASVFRAELFDNTPDGKNAFFKQADYIRKINGRIALHFANLFEREILRMRDKEFDRLQMKLQHESLVERLKKYYAFATTTQVPETNEMAPEILITTNKFGKSLIYSSDSLYALLKLGKSLLNFIAWELRDPNLMSKLELRTKDEKKLEEVNSLIALIQNNH